MDKSEAIKYLQELKLLFEEFESVETRDKDIEALGIAIKVLINEG